jgi:hypothetical protein
VCRQRKASARATRGRTIWSCAFSFHVKRASPPCIARQRHTAHTQHIYVSHTFITSAVPCGGSCTHSNTQTHTGSRLLYTELYRIERLTGVRSSQQTSDPVSECHTWHTGDALAHGRRGSVARRECDARRRRRLAAGGRPTTTCTDHRPRHSISQNASWTALAFHERDAMPHRVSRLLPRFGRNPPFRGVGCPLRPARASRGADVRRWCARVRTSARISREAHVTEVPNACAIFSMKMACSVPYGKTAV